jgi:hypothetical protein
MLEVKIIYGKKKNDLSCDAKMGIYYKGELVTLNKALKLNLEFIESKDFRFYVSTLFKQLEFRDQIELRKLSYLSKLRKMNSLINVSKNIKVDLDRYYYYK